MSKSTLDEFESKTTGKLPERVKKKASKKSEKVGANKVWTAKVIK